MVKPLNMNQKQQFNAELYFANPQAWTLETRSGRKSLGIEKWQGSTFQYKVTLDSGNLFVTENGKAQSAEYATSIYDLFMIPLTTDIPFTLEDFKTGKYDVVSIDDNIGVAEYVKVLGRTVVCIFNLFHGTYHTQNTEDVEQIKLRPKPITPFTHPELYEVSQNSDRWHDIEKYLHYVEAAKFEHIAFINADSPTVWKHLRLKSQPTIITQQQADEAIKEKYGKFKIEG